MLLDPVNSARGRWMQHTMLSSHTITHTHTHTHTHARARGPACLKVAPLRDTIASLKLTATAKQRRELEGRVDVLGFLGGSR